MLIRVLDDDFSLGENAVKMLVERKIEALKGKLRLVLVVQKLLLEANRRVICLAYTD